MTWQLNQGGFFHVCCAPVVDLLCVLEPCFPPPLEPFQAVPLSMCPQCRSPSSFPVYSCVSHLRFVPPSCWPAASLAFRPKLCPLGLGSAECSAPSLGHVSYPMSSSRIIFCMFMSTRLVVSSRSACCMRACSFRLFLPMENALNSALACLSPSKTVGSDSRCKLARFSVVPCLPSKSVPVQPLLSVCLMGALQLKANVTQQM